MSIRINGQVIASATDITDYSKKTGNETLSGVKTFSSSPIIPTPSYKDNSTNAANTEWIRNNIAPAGSVMIWAGTTVPTGYLLCDGSAVSRTTYSDLFSAIGTTYGVGDGSSTFNLPNFNGRYLKGFGANTDSVGTYGTQTLPNITGYMQRVSAGTVTGNFSGAFSETANWTNNNLSSTGIPNYIQEVFFDASKSNSVYGNYNVNPYNVIMMVCIKY